MWILSSIQAKYRIVNKVVLPTPIETDKEAFLETSQYGYTFVF